MISLANHEQVPEVKFWMRTHLTITSKLNRTLREADKEEDCKTTSIK